MDELDRAILNHLQGGFPVSERPFLAAAQELGSTEEELISRLSQMLAQRRLTRFGPLYNADRMGGAFTLAALSVPAADIERVADLLNAMPEVAHNYERAHRLNMWFVLATDTPEGIGSALRRIESETGCRVYNFPKLREYFVELKLAV